MSGGWDTERAASLLPEPTALRRTPRRTVRLARTLSVGLVAGAGIAALLAVPSAGTRALTAVAAALAVVAVATLTSPTAGRRGGDVLQVRTGVAVVVLAVTSAVLLVDLGLDARSTVLLLGVIALTSAYVLPSPRRELVIAGAVVAWLAALLAADVRDLDVLAAHASGAVLLAITTARTAAVAESAVAARAELAGRSGERAVLLAAVLRMQSLEVAVIERALCEAARQLGFGTPQVVDGAALDGARGARDDRMALPLGDDGAALVVDRGTSTGPGRIRSLELLVEEAAGSLDRAHRHADDAATVAELRRLEALTQDFVATVSHELRTPVTVIAGLGRTVADRWDDLSSERRADLLRRIDANADRLANMVRSLVDSSALERGELSAHLQELDLVALADEVVTRLRPLLGEHRIELAVPAGTRVVADPDLLRHAVENLLANVGHHTPQGTTAVLSAERIGGRVELAVTDDGPGIAAADLPHVAERFYRPDPSRVARPGGLGLGLSLVRQIAALHGGELTVRSDPPRGVRFAFTLAGAPPAGSGTSSAS